MTTSDGTRCVCTAARVFTRTAQNASTREPERSVVVLVSRRRVRGRSET
jgi:hypothetical protein